MCLCLFYAWCHPLIISFLCSAFYKIFLALRRKHCGKHYSIRIHRNRSRYTICCQPNRTQGKLIPNKPAVLSYCCIIFHNYCLSLKHIPVFGLHCRKRYLHESFWTRCSIFRFDIRYFIVLYMAVKQGRERFNFFKYEIDSVSHINLVYAWGNDQCKPFTGI